MKKIAYAVIVAFLICSSFSQAMADHPAVGYWFVDVAKLADAVGNAADVSNISEATLNTISECYGHFRGKTDLWIHAKTLQVRIKADDDGRDILYSFSLWQQSLQKESVISQGTAVVTDRLVAKDNWQKDDYVLIMKRMNLKQ